jgi:hypothetical protein
MKKTAKQTVRASDRAARDFVSGLGGRATRASGAGLEKGDGRVRGKFRTETKCPPTGRYRITYREWEKIWNAAVSGGEVALMHLKLFDIELVILRQQDFIGFGGVLEKTCVELGLQKGHTFSKNIWMKHLVWSPHTQFGLTDGIVERWFVALDRTSFMKLMENA